MLLKEKERILFQNEHFFLTPSLGPLVEGHLLACSKEHLTAMGYLDKDWGRKLRSIRQKVESVFQDIYNSKVLLFEHGEVKVYRECKSSGSCVDHMHLHFLPLELSLREDLAEDGMNIQEIDGLAKLCDFVNKNKSYLFVQDKSGKYVATFDYNIPSQYLRQLVAEKIELQEWDWKKYPRKDLFEKSLSTLQKKFN